MMNKKNRLGYMAIEAVIAGAVILGAGTATVSTFTVVGNQAKTEVSITLASE